MKMLISRFSTIFCVLTFSAFKDILAMPEPTSFPILKPEALSLVDYSATENLDAVVIDAEEKVVSANDDGEAIEGTTDATGTTSKSGRDSSEVKEFDRLDCLLLKARGPCRAVIDSWFFNVGTKTCEPFIYSGCRGNNNRFENRVQCEAHCTQPTIPEKVTNASETTTTTKSTTSLTTSTEITTPIPIVLQQKQKPKLPDCPKFEGCLDKCVIIQDRSDRGCKKCFCSTQTPDNANYRKIVASSGNSTVQEPNVSVGSVSGLPVSSAEEESESPALGSPNEVCNLPLTRGNCRAMMTRYRYDAKSKDCVQFHFGGCDGNGNNFVSKEKCRTYCKGQ